MKGLDYAWGGPRGQLGTIKSLGYGFIARYLSSDSSKNLTLQEKNSAMAVGLAVIVVWETSANRIMGGHAAGVADARSADAEVKALGMPGIPIYFACDFDASAAQQATINAYLDGVASVIGHGRTGLYAGYYPIKRSFDAGKIAFGWQTYAWSGGQWDSRAQVRQVQNAIRVLGYDVDLNESVKTDFGQWPRKVGPPPPPVDPTKLTLKQGDSGDPVKYLQQRLNVWGVAKPPLVVDSSFGPATAAAVGELQKEHKLPVDRVVGATTWAILKTNPPVTPPPPPPPPGKTWKDWTTTGTYSLADFAKNVAGTDVTSLLANTAKHYGSFDAATKAYLNGLAAGTVKPTDKIVGAKFWVFQ